MAVGYPPICHGACGGSRVWRCRGRGGLGEATRSQGQYGGHDRKSFHVFSFYSQDGAVFFMIPSQGPDIGHCNGFYVHGARQRTLYHFPDLCRGVWLAQIVVTGCSRPCVHRKKINLRTCPAGQAIGIQEVHGGSSFKNYRPVRPTAPGGSSETRTGIGVRRGRADDPTSPYTGLEPLFGSKIVQSACCWPPARNLDPMKSWRR
jgi:hypothetical protein